MGDQGDLPRAFRFAVSHIQPGANPAAPMSDQDREWLKEVIGQMASSSTDGVKDPDDRPIYRSIADVLRSFAVLIEKGNTAHLKEAVASELQHIAEEAELLDRADDNERKNSVGSIKTIFSMATKEAMAPLCSILAELAQNSPGCQSEAMCLIPRLTEIVKSHEYSAQAKSKAVYALSAIIRGNPSPDVPDHLFATQDREEGLVDVLTKLVCESDESVQVRTKAAFLLNCLVSDHDVRSYLFEKKEKDFQGLHEKNESIKELVDAILQSIQTTKLAEDEPLLALKM
ncbi:uncharacterized protein LOC100908392 [Galendromus occidentalis]|uniref:Uncharacterized protein LOC100908392 n=1 Tax=Galendromus occidentalis TaxID=34638 RepID=A0AAJ6QKP7_9ACAR|nr:uncharacterized protein LOC100908392 [Galendromus occidentalis]